ncbi:N-acetyltransferase GCN5 [Favolaschia claudopus]|uniref:N-acetyltransferase GCN5 n=1 Tax=Favolaschia claudopus TaxID=2862362 RepID=A0AAW0CGK4_9AGAR
MSITLRPFTSSESDSEFVWSCFSARVEWLASKGLDGQWGHWDSDTKEKIRASLPADTAKGARSWIAEVDGAPAGFLQLTPFRAEYLPFDEKEDKPGKEIYVKALVVHPDFKGKGVGEYMLRYAKGIAEEEKADWLRLDCWRGPEGKDGLVKYYEGQGFARAREFVTPAPAPRAGEWPGQLLEMKIAQDSK